MSVSNLLSKIYKMNKGLKHVFDKQVFVKKLSKLKIPPQYFGSFKGKNDGISKDTKLKLYFI
jgi:hypothetical protein